MDFDTLYEIAESTKNGPLSDKDGKVLVEYQPYQTYRDQLNAGIGNSAVGYNQYTMTKMIDATNVAFSAQQMEELLSRAKNVLPWPLDKTPEQFKTVYDTIRDIRTNMAQAYSGNVMLNSAQKEVLKKDMKRLQKVQRLIVKMLNEIGSFEK